MACMQEMQEHFPAYLRRDGDFAHHERDLGAHPDRNQWRSMDEAQRNSGKYHCDPLEK
jgi:hypothetical protein